MPADGLAVVDKEAGPTSHDVVARARRQFGTKKIGHAGTLDPDATGVLLLGVGRATRLLKYLSGLAKSYTGEVVFGTETDTLDDAGQVVATHAMAGLDLDQVRAAAATLTGDILQVPPMVSALKVGGRRLHELARAGIEVERDARPVTVSRFDVAALADGVATIEVDCSTGTYVRTLAADLGHALGGGAHLRRLRRTVVGPFTLADAHALAEAVVLPPAAALPHLALVAVDSYTAGLVRTGRRLRREGEAVVFAGDGPWRLVDEAGNLLAVYEAGDALAVPGVVLPKSE